MTGTVNFPAHSPFFLRIDAYLSLLFITFIAGEFTRLLSYNLIDFSPIEYACKISVEKTTTGSYFALYRTVHIKGKG